jgi:hypothetical protein
MRCIVLDKITNPPFQIRCHLHVLLVCLDESVETGKKLFKVCKR